MYAGYKSGGSGSQNPLHICNVRHKSLMLNLLVLKSAVVKVADFV